MTRPTIPTDETRKVNEAYWQYKTNPIIHGYFPHYKTQQEQVVSRINKFLAASLLVMILASFIGYYFVTSGEVELNKLRKATLALNDDNIDLQNRLDGLKSYYNVDKKMKQEKMLQKAQEVIEVAAVHMPEKTEKSDKSTTDLKLMLGY